MPANPKTNTPAPRAATTFASQELELIRVVLAARGWTLTDSKQDLEGLTIIARRRFPQESLASS